MRSLRGYRFEIFDLCALSGATLWRDEMTANEFIDTCEVYFELPLTGTLEDAGDFIAGFDTEVRLAAVALMEAYAERKLEVRP
jgi:hypothetical protein